MDAAETLTSYAEAIIGHDWDALAALLAPGFTARLLHSGETFDRAGFVAFNRDYPGPWTFVAEETVGAGPTAVLRARVESAPGTYHVASFGTVDEAGRLVDLREVWASPDEPPTSAERRSVRSMTHLHHTIDYVELNVGSAMAPTRTFYERAFGWAFNDYGDEYAGIRWSSGDGEVGGLNASREAVRGGPLVLLYSDDLDATVTAVREAGGEVVEGPYDFPGGRRFHFLDPAGNELGVWSSS